MVLTTDEYDAAYFGDLIESGGLRHTAGYSDYLETTKKFTADKTGKVFNRKAEEWKKLLETLGLENTQITELGGGTGTLAATMLEDGFDWTCVEVANWCFRHKEIPDINFIEQAALPFLQAQGNNSIGAIVSTRFIDCFDDTDAQILIDEMRRTTRKQIHVVDEQANATFYNIRTLEQWRDDFSWPNNNITLISYETGRVISF